MATEAEMRMHRCCFTGHRPQKLTRPSWLVKMDLEKVIKREIKDGYTTFISGMAQGVDIGPRRLFLNSETRVRRLNLSAPALLRASKSAGMLSGSSSTVAL